MRTLHFLHTFADANGVGNSDDRASMTAYVVFLGVNLVSGSSKKQKTVA